LHLQKTDDTDARVPYRDLYIYYLDGPLGDDKERDFGPHFLGNWLEEGNSFLFFSRSTSEFVGGIVTKGKRLRLIDEFHFTYEEWQGGKIKPFTIPPFFVVPPWEDKQENSEEIKMVLDPGVVFGTTLHPTTRDSLTAIATIYEKHRIDQVLDLGTGTGILAVGAALLGAQSVLAVDINPLAVRTAIANVRLNGLKERVEVREGRAENCINHQADLVVANIHYDAIMELMRHKEFRNKKWFILSGLMRNQADKVRAALSQNDAEIIQEWNQEMIWHTFLGRGKGFQDE
jgi:ribosomal protein L11 methyltransferase